MMTAVLELRNESSTKRLLRRDALERLANRICDGEQVDHDVSISVLFCDDDYMARLNESYLDKKGATDVLSFEQTGPETDGPEVLGDIVISLQTAARNCRKDRARMRREVDLLFCHGLLHLLGYDHATQRDKKRMIGKQAEYLEISNEAAWGFGPKFDPRKRRRN